MARIWQTGDLHPLPTGTALSVSASANGGMPILTTVGSAPVYDTGRPLTPNARGSLRIETPSGTTTTRAMVLGNLPADRIAFDGVIRRGVDTLQNHNVLAAYDVGGTLSWALQLQSGVPRMVQRSGASLSGQSAASALAIDTDYRVSGWVSKGTTTADGSARVTITREADGVVVWDYTAAAISTSTVQLRQIHVGKVTATGGGTTGVLLWVQDWVLADTATADPIEIVAAAPSDVVSLHMASNMKGSAAATPADYPYAADVYMLSNRAPLEGRLVRAEEFLRHPDSITQPGLGPAWRFAQRYVAERLATGRRLVLVPNAHGGTGFTLPDSNNSSPGMSWAASPPAGSVSRLQFALDAIQRVLALSSASSKVVAVLSNAGSTDGSNNTSKAAYRPLYLAYIDALHAALGADVPLVFMQSRPSLLRNEQRHRDLDDVQQETAGVLPGFERRAKVMWVPSPDGDQYNEPDVVHFNATGISEIGSRLFDGLALAEANTGTDPEPGLPAQVFERAYLGAKRLDRLYLGTEDGAELLWQGGPQDVQSLGVIDTNIATDARGISSAPTIGWRSTRWYGGNGTTGAHSAVTGASDGPTPALDSYRRKTWNVAVENNAGGDTGYDLMSSGIAVTPGERWWMAGWMRTSRVGRLIYARCTATKLDGTNMGSNIALPRPDGTSSLRSMPEGWEWIVAYYDVADGVERMNLRFDSPGNAAYWWRQGDTLDGTGLYIGKVQPRRDSWFDGLLPSDVGAGFRYEGGAGPSTKTLYRSL